MKQKIYQIDAFTGKVFAGNPAAVCPLEEWLPDEVMQNIAMENNLAETAFFRKEGEEYAIRWFTPKAEVALCGHATLAAAYVLFNYENYMDNTVCFHSKESGCLFVRREGDLLIMNFPADRLKEIPVTADLIACFNKKPIEAYKGKTDYLLIFPSEKDILLLHPDLESIARLDARGVIASAQGDQTDFVSRFFAPNVGVNEDPVTGSAHTTLTPYWAGRLNKLSLTAFQLSERKGLLKCNYIEDRVEIAGQCAPYLAGEIFLED